MLYATNFPVAYVKRVPGIAFVVFSSFLGKSRSADKKISSGAPFIICAYRLPLEPLEINILPSFLLSKFSFNTFIGFKKFEATPI